jgi:hypothetical protein
MHVTMQQEQFSRAWVRALAAVAGYNITQCEVDDDSIDLGLTGNRKVGVHVRAPKLEFQLTCCSNDDERGTHLSYPLKVKNYDAFVIRTFMFPASSWSAAYPRAWATGSTRTLGRRR